MPQRILLLAYGSHGDVHPSIAVAGALSRLGHEAAVVANPYFARAVAAGGVDFIPFGEHEDLGVLLQTPGVMAPLRGPVRLLRDLVLPRLESDAARLGELLAVEKPTGVVLHPLSLFAPHVCERAGVPYASTALAPISWWNPRDGAAPSALSNSRTSLTMSRISMWIGARMMRWAVDGPVRRVRRVAGLPPGRDHFPGVSRGGVLSLGLWSRHFRGAFDGDPAQGVITGFVWHDRARAREEDAHELSRFLAEGEEPIVFTMGTAAVHVAGNFYEAAARACANIGRRGLLLVGRAEYTPKSLPPGVRAFSYAPYSEVFPRCRILVHHGGIGTTGQALRAGKPQLVIPMAHDQFDNAARVKRLGVGVRIAHARASERALTEQLGGMLDFAPYAEAAREIASKLRDEDGAPVAAAALVRAFGG